MSHFIVHEKKKTLYTLHILNKELHKIQSSKVYSKKISLLRAICLKNFFKQHTITLEWLRNIIQSHTPCRKRIQFVESFYNCMIENKVYNPNTIFITN
jgi:hypothetical protein